MVDVDEVVTDSMELQEHIDNYERPFTIKIGNGFGVDIIKEFRELDNVDLEYDGFKEWEIDPPSEANGEAPIITDAQSSKEDIESADSNLQLSHQTIRSLFATLVISLLASWAVFFWILFPEFIRENSPLLSLIGLIIAGVSLFSTRFIL